MQIFETLPKMKGTRKSKKIEELKDFPNLKWYATPPSVINPGPQIRISEEYAKYIEQSMDIDDGEELQVNGQSGIGKRKASVSKRKPNPDKLMRDLVKKLVS